jgi:hypothetical protein
VITSEVQYRATKAHLRRFEEAADDLEAKTGAGDQSKLTQVELDAVRAQADDLRNEIDEYERLCSRTVSTFEASSLVELATLLVKARIARGWTQRRLADALGVAEQLPWFGHGSEGSQRRRHTLERRKAMAAAPSPLARKRGKLVASGGSPSR